MKNATAIACLLMLFPMVCGCGSSSQDSKPTVAEGEKVLSDGIPSESEGRIKVAKFSKTDGQSSVVNGVAMYKMEFQAELEFTEDCKWRTRSVLDNAHTSFRTVKLPPEASSDNFSWSQWDSDTQTPGTVMKRGQRQQISGTLTFEKSEKGWRGDLTRIDFGKPSAPVAATDSSAPSRSPGTPSASLSKAQINQREANGRTRLHNAIAKRDLAAAKELLEQGADLNIEESNGERASPWYSACQWDNIAAMKLLLEHGADVNARFRGGLSPLKLVSTGEAAMLLLPRGAKMDGAFEEAWLKSLDYSTALLTCGAKIDPKDAKPLRNAALHGAEKGDPRRVKGTELVDVLLAAGADINARDRDGMTALGALLRAASTTQPSDRSSYRGFMVEYLRSKGARE